MFVSDLFGILQTRHGSSQLLVLFERRTEEEVHITWYGFELSFCLLFGRLDGLNVPGAEVLLHGIKENRSFLLESKHLYEVICLHGRKQFTDKTGKSCVGLSNEYIQLFFEIQSRIKKFLQLVMGSYNYIQVFVDISACFICLSIQQAVCCVDDLFQASTNLAAI